MSPRIVVAALLCAVSATAQEKKNDAPRITAITPLSVVAGETQTIRLRGLKLKDVTEIRSTLALSVTVTEKKDAAPANGLEAKDVGDQELVVEWNVPADCAAKTIALEAVAPAGTSAPRGIFIVVKDADIREKEPNNGFREAVPWDMAKPLAVRIVAAGAGCCSIRCLRFSTRKAACSPPPTTRTEAAMRRSASPRKWTAHFVSS